MSSENTITSNNAIIGSDLYIVDTRRYKHNVKHNVDKYNEADCRVCKKFFRIH